MNKFKSRAKVKFISSIYGRFFHLLISILIFFLLFALLVNNMLGRIIVEISFSVVLLASLRVVSDKRENFIIASVLFILVIVSRWFADFTKIIPLIMISNSITVINLSFIALNMLISILKKKEISLDDIYGTICVYLLIGLIFGFLYFTIESYHPGAFSISAQAITQGTPDEKLVNLLYFSFITLTTVGYGDILPLSLLAKTLSYMEAVIGQIYLAVLVARLIAIYVASLARENRSI